MLEWPELWKLATVSVITKLKNSASAGLGELNNLYNHNMICGWGVDYDGMKTDARVQTLLERREENVKKFALKTEQDDRFGGRWVVKREEIGIGLRGTTRRKY